MEELRNQRDSLSLITPLNVNASLKFLDDISQGNIVNENGEPLMLYDMHQHEQRMTRKQTRPDTFCIAAAVALTKDYRRAPDVRREIVMFFATIMFGALPSGCETPDQLLEKETQKKLALRNECVEHPAVQMWIRRKHLKNKELHKAAADWLEAYPDRLRREALLFIRDHKKSSKGRVLCKYTFALLLADCYRCKVKFYQEINPFNQIPKVEETQWFFSKDTLDDECDFIDIDVDGEYYQGVEYSMKNSTSVIMYHANRSFNLLLTKEHFMSVLKLEASRRSKPSQKRRSKKRTSKRSSLSAPVLVPSPQSMRRNNTHTKKGQEGSIYVLRRFSIIKDDPQNHVVGDFEETSDGSCVFIFRFDQTERDPEHIYMLHPKHQVTGSRHLMIPNGCRLYVYFLQPENKIRCTTLYTDSIDVSPHFKIPTDSIGVVVVTASDDAEAKTSVKSAGLNIEVSKEKR